MFKVNKILKIPEFHLNRKKEATQLWLFAVPVLLVFLLMMILPKGNSKAIEDVSDRKIMKASTLEKEILIYEKED
jgi:hypothetical protein